MQKLAVIALGGNALLRGDQAGTIDEQEQNTTDTLENLVFLLKQGYNLVITHVITSYSIHYTKLYETASFCIFSFLV